MNDILKQRTAKLQQKYKMFTETQFIGTGSLILDIVMGGGLPVGKMIEIASEAGVGKTTISLSLCREMLKQGKKIIYLDHEGAITTSQLEGIFGKENYTKWLYQAGTNEEGTFFLFPVSTYSEAEEVLDMLIGTNEFSLVVVDSVAAMINDAYLTDVINPESKDKSISVADVRPAMDAMALGKFLKKYKAVCMKFNCTMILINQLRTKLSLTGGPSTKVSTGGASIEFYPDIRLKLEKPSIITQKKKTINGEEATPVGCEAIIYASKNKLTNAKIKVPITIIFGRGISNIKSYMNWLPNKQTPLNGELVPMLRKKGGGYNVVALNNKEYTLRGDEELTKFIAEHFEEIKKNFTYKDFEITEQKDFAEFKADGTSIYSEEPGESFSMSNDGGSTGITLDIEEDEESNIEERELNSSEKAFLEVDENESIS